MLSFFLLLFSPLHLYFGFPSLERTDPRCEGRKKTLAHIGLPSGSVQIIFLFFFFLFLFSRVGNYRETLN